jgi:hypothetical protein
MSGVTLQAVANGVVFKYSFKNSSSIRGKEFSDSGVSSIQQIYELVNELRKKAGMTPLQFNSKLQEASIKHIEYLLENRVYSHYEKEGESGFIGTTPMDRGRYVGYKPLYYVENLTIGFINAKNSIDALMQSVYHRFGFLDFYVNEIGVGYKDLIHNYNMGNSKNIDVTADGNPAFVLWPPNGYENTQVLFANFENPNPLLNEDCVIGGVTGNPISVQFNPHTPDIIFESFRLFSGEKEIATLTNLDKLSDPNGILTSKEFLIFPAHPLKINTSYTAIFKGYIGGEQKVISWNFKTRAYDYPRYRVENGKSYDVIKDKTYIIHIIPEDCSSNISGYNYEGYADIEYIDLNIVKITPHSNIHFVVGNVKFDLVLSDTDSAVSPSESGGDSIPLTQQEESAEVDLSAKETEDGVVYLLEKDSLKTSLDLKRDDNPVEIDKIYNTVKIDLGDVDLESNEKGEILLLYKGDKIVENAIPLGSEIVIDDQEIRCRIKNPPDRLKF